MSDIVTDTFRIINEFREKHPGKRIAIIEGQIILVPETKNEEKAFQETVSWCDKYKENT